MTKRYLNRDAPPPSAIDNMLRGIIDESDKGELNMAITRGGNTIRIDFGQPVAWIAFEPADAIALARILLKHAGAKSVEVKL